MRAIPASVLTLQLLLVALGELCNLDLQDQTRLSYADADAELELRDLISSQPLHQRRFLLDDAKRRLARLQVPFKLPDILGQFTIPVGGHDLNTHVTACA